MALLLIGAGLAGCGGDDEEQRPQGPTREEYVKRVDSICQRFGPQVNKVQASLRTTDQIYSSSSPAMYFGRLAPDLARLRTLNEEGLREIRSVPLPREGAVDARAWQAALRDSIAFVKRFQSAIANQDIAQVRRLLQQEAPTVQTRTQTRAQKLGLKVCGNDDDAQPGQQAQPPPTQPPPGQPPPGQPPPGQPPDENEGPSTARAGVREKLPVRSQEGEVVLRVLRVRPRVRSSRYSRPDEGNKVVGVDLEIENVGSRVFSPPLSASLKLIDTGGGSGDYQTLIDGPCGRGFALRLSVTPGSTEQGCIPFQIDQDRQPRTLQVRFGYGDDQVIAEFDLTGRGGGGSGSGGGEEEAPAGSSPPAGDPA